MAGLIEFEDLTLKVVDHAAAQRGLQVTSERLLILVGRVDDCLGTPCQFTTKPLAVASGRRSTGSNVDGIYQIP
jgi:hypothetical protein